MVDSEVARQAVSAPKRPKGRARKRAPTKARWDSLFHWDDLPEYLKDNEYIYTGYRVHTGVLGSFKSLFRIHNESGNVWTHLLGFILFFCLLLCILQAPPTPLALRRADASHMWASMASRLRNTSSTLVQRIGSTQTDTCEITALDAPTWETNSVSGRTLKEYLLDSIHSFEAQLQSLPTLVSDHLHSIGDVIRHPQDGIKRVSGYCQDSLTARMQQLRDGVGQSLANVRSSVTENLQSAAKEAAAPPAELQHVSQILESWLRVVVQKAVHWPVARWPQYVYMAGAMNCLLLSAMCHLLGSSNRDYFSTIWRFDYAGIVGMIVTSFFPSVYYVFLCQPTVRWTYLTGISVFGALTLMLSLLNRFQTVRWRATRATCFSLLGLFGLVPWGHVIWTKAYENPTVHSVMMLDAVMGACYLAGATIYANRVPEKWFPGKFDLFFHSHQIFHIFVVVAAYAHYLGVLELVAWRDASGGCAVEVSSGSLGFLSEEGREIYDVDGLLCFFQDQIPTLWNHVHQS